ncbi:MAG: DUF3899 domain-containing protein [Clostridia bacterium]|nr:DUF3899 domain-containing protein [Clostridia bacterium]
MDQDKKTKKTVLKYGIAVICGAALTAVMISLNNPFREETTADKFRFLCDAFSVPGILLICVGILVWLSGEGAFNGLGYLFRYLRRSLIPGGRTRYPHETYYDYVQEKSGKKGGGFGFLFIVGGAFLLVGLVFLVLFYKYYNG